MLLNTFSGNKTYNASTNKNRNIPSEGEKFCQTNGRNIKKHLSSDDPFLTEKGIYLTFLYICFGKEIIATVLLLLLMVLLCRPVMPQLILLSLIWGL